MKKIYLTVCKSCTPEINVILEAIEEIELIVKYEICKECKPFYKLKIKPQYK
jgi:uncharacterized Zn finger protein